MECLALLTYWILTATKFSSNLNTLQNIFPQLSMDSRFKYFQAKGLNKINLHEETY
jgi:hypothetical protein